MLDFGSFDALSFDCYGTLIDWETGIIDAMTPLLNIHGIAADSEEVLRIYSKLESAAQADPFVPYESVLRSIVKGFAERYEFNLQPGQENRLVQSLPAWPPFSDTVASLRKLKERYRLAIFSNISDALLSQTLKILEVDFDCLITADRTRSYKPNPKHFLLGLEKLEIPKEKLLHVAESQRHDIEPAKELGIATVWVNRQTRKTTASGKGAGTASPDMEVKSLEELAGLMGV
ncbi:MAG: haloacid dehalogenase type II [Candidatus Omnitrophica bacterium]|nr:haloacid dehalogenase type II [Candidatus Omnitrophota bacterium]